MKAAIQKFDEAANGLCNRMQPILHNLPDYLKEKAQEIRLRAGKPLVIVCPDEPFFLTQAGRPTSILQEGLLVAKPDDIEASFQNLCGYSVHSHQNELKQGFLTIRGGHRAGICGTAVVTEGKISSVRDISSINLRISRDIPGAADEIFLMISWKHHSGLLLAGPPASGKTTLLKDIGRQLSEGRLGIPSQVVFVDERGEFAGTDCGNAGQLGPCCDVLSGYPKGLGIMQAVRTLSPQFIICDEVGDMEEIKGMKEGVNAGVRMIASVHAGGREDLFNRLQIRELLLTGAFAGVALLAGQANTGKIEKVYPLEEILDEMDRHYIDHTRGRRSGLFPVKEAI